MQTTKRNIFSVMLLLVAIFNLTSTTLFLHTHLLNEQIIVHSHPFASSPDSHSHTASSLDIISRQTISEAVITQAFSFSSWIDCSLLIFATSKPSNVTEYSGGISSLRAPPQIA